MKGIIFIGMLTIVLITGYSYAMMGGHGIIGGHGGMKGGGITGGHGSHGSDSDMISNHGDAEGTGSHGSHDATNNMMDGQE